MPLSIWALLPFQSMQALEHAWCSLRLLIVHIVCSPIRQCILCLNSVPMHSTIAMLHNVSLDIDVVILVGARMPVNVDSCLWYSGRHELLTGGKCITSWEKGMYSMKGTP